MTESDPPRTFPAYDGFRNAEHVPRSGFMQDGLMYFGRPIDYAADDEIAVMLADRIAEAQARIDDAIAAGVEYIATSKMHTIHCPTVRAHLDIRARYDLDRYTPRQALDVLDNMYTPSTFLTAAEAAQRRLRRCRTCCADTVEPGPPPRPTTAAGNLRRDHLGRTVGGRALVSFAHAEGVVMLVFGDDEAVSVAPEYGIEFDPKPKEGPQ